MVQAHVQVYRSCWSGHKILVTGFFFRTALGKLFLCTGQSRVKVTGQLLLMKNYQTYHPDTLFLRAYWLTIMRNEMRLQSYSQTQRRNAKISPPKVTQGRRLQNQTQVTVPGNTKLALAWCSRARLHCTPYTRYFTSH